MTEPNFDAMTKEQVIEWLADADDMRPWVEWAKPTSFPGTFVQVDENNQPMLKVVTVKMPVDMVTRLDSAAGRDREGRSGVIRQAVEEWFERHPEQQAEAA